MDALNTLNGFGNLFSDEAVSSALPVGRNSPQRVARCLVVERLSGSAFTVPHAENRWRVHLSARAQRKGARDARCADCRAALQNHFKA